MGFALAGISRTLIMRAWTPEYLAEKGLKHNRLDFLKVCFWGQKGVSKTSKGTILGNLFPVYRSRRWVRPNSTIPQFHMDALRYILFSHIFMQEGTFHFGKHRKNISDALELMSFASLLWTLFKAIIHGALDDFKSLVGHETLQTIKDHIDCTVAEFLNQALQLDPKSLIEESRAEEAGTIC